MIVVFFIGSVEPLTKYKNILVNISWQKGPSAKTVEGPLGMPQGPRGTIGHGGWQGSQVVDMMDENGLIRRWMKWMDECMDEMDDNE